MILAHLVRDWSAAGASARARTHPPVLRALRALRRDRGQPGGRLRVLVPGAGLCRLAWEIARQGFRVEANDASAAMLVAAQTLLSGAALPAAAADGRLRLVPRVRCGGGVVSRAACFELAAVPDACVSGAPGAPAAALTLEAVGSWYAAACGGTFDAVVTSYFLDALPDAAEAVRYVWSKLAPGGVWVNVGPLQWHDASAGLLRFTLDELLALLRLSGFEVSTLRRIPRVPYLGGSRRSRAARRGWVLGMGAEWHDCVLWVARVPQNLTEA